MPSGCGPDTGEGASGPQPEGIRATCSRVRSGSPADSGPPPAFRVRDSEDAGQDFLLRLCVVVLVLVQIGLPCLGVPDLQPGDRTDHHALLVEPGVAPQLGRDRAAPLAVRSLLVGA